MMTLEYLRGITSDDVRRLRALGARNTLELLHITTLEIDRATVSRKTGIPEPRLLEFAHQCALLEISGVERYVPVLRRLGITSQKALKRADAADLHARVRDALGAAGSPTLSTVEYWIAQARSIDVIEDLESEEAPVQA